VVGAGLAGLRCADILLQHGFRVTIIEARNRVGGRLHQEVLPNGRLADVGPNWIHGTNDNPMLDLAKQTNTAVGSWDLTSCVFDEDGELFTVEDGEKYSDVMWQIVQDAFKHSNNSSQDIDPKESLHDFFVQKVAEKIPSTEKDHERKRKIVMQISELWGAFVGSPIYRQSLKFFWLEECIEGGKFEAEPVSENQTNTHQRTFSALARTRKCWMLSRSLRLRALRSSSRPRSREYRTELTLKTRPRFKSTAVKL
jgi:uncharacterized protein with NAD-binding domain and iron-sulfur cluster